jgi:hypothetical protein
MMAIIQEDENANTSRRRVVESSESLYASWRLHFLHDYIKKKQSLKI